MEWRVQAAHRAFGGGVSTCGNKASTGRGSIFSERHRLRQRPREGGVGQRIETVCPGLPAAGRIGLIVAASTATCRPSRSRAGAAAPQRCGVSGAAPASGRSDADSLIELALQQLLRPGASGKRSRAAHEILDPRACCQAALDACRQRQRLRVGLVLRAVHAAHVEAGALEVAAPVQHLGEREGNGRIGRVELERRARWRSASAHRRHRAWQMPRAMAGAIEVLRRRHGSRELHRLRRNAAADTGTSRGCCSVSPSQVPAWPALVALLGQLGLAHRAVDEATPRLNLRQGRAWRRATVVLVQRGRQLPAAKMADASSSRTPGHACRHWTDRCPRAPHRRAAPDACRLPDEHPGSRQAGSRRVMGEIRPRGWAPPRGGVPGVHAPGWSVTSPAS